jgi:putative DNA primase/helicase
MSQPLKLEPPNMLEWALWYAELEYQVFPLHNPALGLDGKLWCSCGKHDCDKPAKHPRWLQDSLEHGHLCATTDTQLIRTWWRKWSKANIGIRPAGNWFGLDVDERGGGVTTLRLHCEEYGELPLTPQALSGSGSGSSHYWFKRPADAHFSSSQGKRKEGEPGPLGFGLDIKTDAGYLVAPPSLHISGNRYQWEITAHLEDTPLAEAPAWMIELLTAPVPGSNGNFTVPDPTNMTAGTGRNPALYALGRALKAKELPRAAIEETLRAYNRRFKEPYSDSAVAKLIEHILTQPDRSEFAADRSGGAVIIIEDEPPLPDEPEYAQAIGNILVIDDAEGNGPPPPPNGAAPAAAPAAKDEPLYEPGLGSARISAKQLKQLQRSILGWNPASVELVATREVFELHLARDITGYLFCYRNGTYEPDGERLLRHAAKVVIPPGRWSVNLVNGAVVRATDDAPLLWERPPRDTVNLLSGLLDVRTRKLEPHTPEHLSPVQLPVRYDPKATALGWDAQAKATFPADAYAAGIHWQIPAWLMVAHTGAQKAFMLTGEGGCGKSIFLRMLRRFLGGRNCATVSLHDLSENRFAAADLIGKLANIFPDLLAKELEDTGLFRTITGEDATQRVERKYKHAADANIFARMVFSANRTPVVIDATDAFFQRWWILPFSHQFRGTAEEIDSTRLVDSVTTPAELSGVLNRALEVLPQVLAEGITVTESMRQALLEFRRQADPISAWLDIATVCDPTNEFMFTPCELVIDAYNADCRAKGLAGMTPHAFGRALTALRPQVERAQRTVNGKDHVGVYLHLRLKEKDES